MHQLVKQVPTIQTVQKTVDGLPVQYIDQLVDVSVAMQSPVPTTQAQHVDKVSDVPVVMRRPFAAVQSEQKSAEVRQTQHFDIIDMPVELRRQVLLIQQVPKTVEVAQAQCVEFVVDVPVSPISEETVPVVKCAPQERFQQRTDVLVAMQRQVPTIQKVQQTAEVPTEVQYNDRIADVPVA